jgi:hypothetical protein
MTERERKSRSEPNVLICIVLLSAGNNISIELILWTRRDRLMVVFTSTAWVITQCTISPSKQIDSNIPTHMFLINREYIFFSYRTCTVLAISVWQTWSSRKPLWATSDCCSGGRCICSAHRERNTQSVLSVRSAFSASDWSVSVCRRLTRTCSE